MDEALKESYIVLQNAFEKGVPLGSTVRITRTAINYELGWDNIWPCNHDDVGQELTVTDYCPAGVELSNNYFYPFFVLELIKKSGPLEEAQGIAQRLEHYLDFYNQSMKEIVESLKEANSSEEAHQIKKSFLLAHVDKLHNLLTPSCCVYCCMFNNKCSECSYGKEHGICTKEGSDFSKIGEAVARLATTIHDNY